jgi:hypothetical protein
MAELGSLSMGSTPALVPDYFHVIMAGVKGGGHYLTGLRQHIGDKGYVVSSLSTPFGLKRGEYRLKTHYANLTQEILSRAQGKLIRIYAHSLGSIEVLDFMRALAVQPELADKALEVIFISPPGVGQKGIRAIREVGRRLAKVIEGVGLYDQYQLFPLSNESDPIVTQKRRLFLEEWLPRLVQEQQSREKLTQKLEILDAALVAECITPKDDQRGYHHERHQLMKELVEKIMAGKHLSTEAHLHYLHLYGESPGKLANRVWSLIAGLKLLVKTLWALHQGVDRKILAAVERCQKAGIEVKLRVVILGRDELVQSQDYEKLVELALAKDIVISRQSFATEEHSSVAYNWELIDALEAL